jgi:hypothetical protein
MYTYLLLEPLDAATFRPLKLGCKTAVLEWHRQNSDKILRNGTLLFWMELWRSIVWNVQLYRVFELVACTHGIQNTLTSQNELGGGRN